MRDWLRIVFLVTAALLGGALLAALRADDSPAEATSESSAVVVEPAEGDGPTVVRLAPGEDDDKSDPLVIGEFTLIDQNGEEFSSKELQGHPWVAAFIFTRCAGFCPMLVRNLRLEVADRVDDPDVRFVVISVDPEVDTPERLKQYAEIFVKDFDRWAFLTGDKAEIYKLVLHGFRLPLAEMEGEDRLPGFEVAHSLSLIHVGPDGRVIGKYDSRDEQQVLSLRKVLNGQIETPEENRALAGAVVKGWSREESSTADETATPTTLPGREIRGVGALPEWAARLPTTNAMLNALATLLLLAGFVAIKRRHAHLHKRLMLLAFGTSIAFLACYLTYHAALNHYTGTHGKPFEGTGGIRMVYYAILVSHVVLAAVVPVLAIITITLAFRGRWAAHRMMAKVTLPIWLYVSTTGVIIYGMLYHWPR